MDRVVVLSNNDCFTIMALPLQVLVGGHPEGEPQGPVRANTILSCTSGKPTMPQNTKGGSKS